MDYFAAFIAGVVAMFVLVMVPFTDLKSNWQSAAVERGYALYCPATGDFAWKGECDGS